MILVAIGANLNGPTGAPPLETCLDAVRALDLLPGYRVGAVSRWYDSAPVPPSGQPNYVNGVARLDSESPGDPAALLAALHAIEARFGRERPEIGAARTLDLDLIDMNGLIRDTPDPVLPHPRAHLRAFVLMPLLDVAPGWHHPRGLGFARALLDAAGRGGIAVLPEAGFR